MTGSALTDASSLGSEPCWWGVKPSRKELGNSEAALGLLALRLALRCTPQELGICTRTMAAIFSATMVVHTSTFSSASQSAPQELGAALFPPPREWPWRGAHRTASPGRRPAVFWQRLAERRAGDLQPSGPPELAQDRRGGVSAELRRWPHQYRRYVVTSVPSC